MMANLKMGRLRKIDYILAICFAASIATLSVYYQAWAALLGMTMLALTTVMFGKFLPIDILLGGAYCLFAVLLIFAFQTGELSFSTISSFLVENAWKSPVWVFEDWVIILRGIYDGHHVGVYQLEMGKASWSNTRYFITYLFLIFLILFTFFAAWWYYMLSIKEGRGRLPMIGIIIMPISLLIFLWVKMVKDLHRPL